MNHMQVLFMSHVLCFGAFDNASRAFAALCA